jgi:hypothetical protein
LPYWFKIHWTVDFPASVWESAMIFHDFTDDGTEELVLFHVPWHDDSASAFTILDLDGQILYQHPWNAIASGGIGDMNGDGVLELVSMMAFPRHVYNSGDPYERYWEPGAWVAGTQWDGSNFQEIYQFQVDDHFGGGFIVLCDVDGDGKDEVLVRLSEATSRIGEDGTYAGEGRSALFNVTGETLWEYRHFYGSPFRLVIDDFTGDGSYEIFIGTYRGQLLVFSTAVKPSLGDYERVFASQLVMGWVSEAEVQWMRSQLLPAAPTAEEGARASSFTGAWLLFALAGCAAGLGARARRRG